MRDNQRAGSMIGLAAWTLVLSVWFSVGCRKSSPELPGTSVPANARASTDVRWISVQTPGNSSLTEFPAVVKADPKSSAVLSSPYSSRVLAVFARAGDKVKAGQNLVTVRMPDLVTAAGELIAARTQLEAYARRKGQLSALKAEGLARLEDISDVDVRLAEARATEQRALGILEGAGVRGSEAQRLVGGQGRVTLRSPIDGTVVEINAVAGAQHEPGAAVLAHVVGTAPGRIEARLAHAIPKGVTLLFRASSGESCPVDELGVSPRIDENDGSRLAWYAPNCDPAPPPGTRGVLSVRFSDAQDVTRIPARSVARTGGGDFVFKRDGDASLPVLVETLVISGAEALVRGTLRAGDTIAADVPVDWKGPAATGANGTTNADKKAPSTDTL